MKKPTIKDMIDRSNIPEKLIRAVIRQSGGFESFAEMAPDISNHGIDGGFHGWVWYTETVKFWKANRKLILEMAEEQAQEFGMGMLEMIQGFGVFRHDPISVDDLARALYQGKGDDAQVVGNVMAWYPAEEVARLYNDLLEDQL